MRPVISAEDMPLFHSKLYPSSPPVTSAVMPASVLSGQNGSTHVNVISNESGSDSVIKVSAVHPLASVMITSLLPALRSVRDAPVPPSDHRYDEVPAALTGVMFIRPVAAPMQLMLFAPPLLSPISRTILIWPDETREVGSVSTQLCPSVTVTI